MRSCERRNRFSYLLAGLSLIAACGISDEEALTNARRLVSAGEYREAMIGLRQVIDRGGTQPEARLLLVRVYLALGRGSAAEAQLEAIAEGYIEEGERERLIAEARLQQGDAEWVLKRISEGRSGLPTGERLLLQARAQLLIGDAKSAIASVEAAERAGLNETRANGILAWAYLLAGEAEQAAKRVDEALRLDPENGEARLIKGELQFRRGEYQKSEQTFRKAAADEKTADFVVIGALNGIAKSVLASGQSNVAAQVAQELLERYPGNQGGLYLCGVAALREYDYETARECFLDYLESDPNSTSALYLLGVSYHGSAMPEQAVMYWKRLVALEPGGWRGRKALAMGYLRLNQPLRAIQLLESGRSQEDADILALLAEAYCQEGDRQTCSSLYEQAVEAAPDKDSYVHRLAEVYLRGGQPDEAIVLLKDKGTQSVPLLAAAYLVRGKVDEAVALVERERTVFRRKPQWGVLAAAVYAANGQFNKANQILEAILEQSPQDIGALLYLGRIAQEQGRVDAAFNYFQQVLTVNPRNTTAISALAARELDNGNWEQAKGLLERLAEEKDEWAGVVKQVTRLMLKRHKLAEAKALLRELQGKTADDPNVTNLAGMLELASGNASEAVRLFELVKDKTTSAHINLALTEMHRGNMSLARQAAETAYTKRKDILSATVLASIELQEGEYETAIALARDEQRRNPRLAAPAILEAELHARTRHHREAAFAYRIAAERSGDPRLVQRAIEEAIAAHIEDPVKIVKPVVEAWPEVAGIHLVLAGAYQNGGQTAQAMNEYRQVLALDKDNPIALNNLAWLYHLAGDHRALPMAERAYDIDPDNGAIADTYGWLLFKNGGPRERAVSILRRAVELSPTQAIRSHLVEASR